MRLPVPPAPTDPDAVAAWVGEHLGDLTREGPDAPVVPSPRFRGGQTAADAALGALQVRGYAGRRNHVHPSERRGATVISPYVRYGLLPLRRVYDHVADAPAKDKQKYRDELLWQEYARHLYARLGERTRQDLRYAPPPAAQRWATPWDRSMRCVEATTDELLRDGWLVNQTRMWLASQWTVRGGHAWRAGEEAFFAHLLDGSRAANRLGWQWAVGSGTGRPYGFSRWQVEKRAPELCATCVHHEDCPIEGWPPKAGGPRVADPPAALKHDPDLARTAGPEEPEEQGTPDAVWLTGESLGDADPALQAHPDLPVVFVFDVPLLAKLKLSGKRLAFLAETLGDLATRRDLHVHRGVVPEELAGHRPAVTFAPVPGFRRIAPRVAPAVVHPWPWLARPHDRSIGSFSAWRKHVRVR